MAETKTKENVVKEKAVSKNSKLSTKKMMEMLKNKMVLAVGAGVLGLVVVLLLVVFAFNKISNSGDEGTSIPSDFQVFENDSLKFGYPKEGWLAEETSTGVNIKEEGADGGIFGATTQVAFSVEKLTEDEDKEDLASLKSQDCKKLEDSIKSQITSGDESFDITLASSEASINNSKGCKFEITADYLGLKLNVLMYSFPKSGSEDEVFQVGITQIGEEKAENYDEYLEILRTFDAK